MKAKRFFAALLCFCMAVSLLPAGIASATDSSNSTWYKIIDDLWINESQLGEHIHKKENGYCIYCTDGLDLRGKHIGVVGHLNMPDSVYAQAASVRILERSPRPGDYPDSACDWLFPQCDVVIMTASTLVNKTLPHLLDLCKNAYTILAGPTCPMCPELLDMGLDRIAGLVITDVDGMKNKIVNEISGPPYPMGKPFLLKKENV